MEKTVPIPQGSYVPATRYGNLIFTAGMTPRNNGRLILSGKIDPKKPLDYYKDAVRQAAGNALTAAQSKLAPGETIRQVLHLTVYVNAESDFQQHSKIADFATQYLVDELGTNGVAARASVGMASLPGNAPVEIEIVCAV